MTKDTNEPSGASGGSVAYRTFDDWHSEVAGFAMRCECLEGPTDELRAAFAAGQSGMRLTDAEREAVEAAAFEAEAHCHRERAATLRGLLARFSPIAKRESDRPQPIADARLAALQQLAELDEEMRLPRTPNPHATPGECTVSPEWTSRPYYVDPPSGWRYGFPKLYDPAKDGDMRAWMIASGYPEHLANQGLACTFTSQTEGVG